MTAHPTPPAPDTPGGTTPQRSLTRSNTQPPSPGAGPFPQDPTACLQPPNPDRSRSTPHK
jgi:hypothetical protein